MPRVIRADILGTRTRRVSRRGIWQSFRHNKLALIGGAIVLLYALFAVLAPLIAPYDPAAQFDAPPGKRNPMPPLSRDADGRLFLLGTDKFGRDILSRAVYATRTLLEVAVGAIDLAMLVGVAAGGVAGYRAGSWLDEVLMRAADVTLSFPPLILAIALVAALGVGAIRLGPLRISDAAKIMLVIAITYWPRFARVTRAVVLQERGREYVLAARAIGASGPRILFVDIIPNAIPPIIVQASLMTATTVLATSALSFLGLGLQPPRPSLGLMLNEARDYLLWGAWWYAVVPGGLITLAVLGFNLLGDGLRDVLDPRGAWRARR